MAKPVTRVHILAKELGVKSKVIVEKCQAEGMDVKNHMSTLSAGRAATIREWFSAGEHKTTVETAAPVDDKYRVNEQKKKTVQSEASSEEDKSEQQEVQEQKAPEQKPIPRSRLTGKTSTRHKTAAKAEKPEAEEHKPEEKKEQTASQKRSASDEPEQKKTDDGKQPQMVELPKAEDIKPAGPRLDSPAPAKLSGPKVVRMESVHKPRHHKKRPGKKGEETKPHFKKKPQTAPQPVPESAQPQPVKSKKDKKKKEHKGGEEEKIKIPKIAKKSKLRGRDVEERKARLAAARGKKVGFKTPRKIESKKKGEQQKPAEQQRPKKASISEPISVKSLSSALAVKVNDIILQLMKQGVMANANQSISVEAAELVALEFGVELEIEHQKTIEEQISEEFENRERNEVKRPAIVTMLGHVDHGKTSLLDKIRSASVASGEAGGITQHVSAYQAEIGGKKVTFLDTPGHAAFTSMRARGANMTDIVVLVVAADDGVMPQTVEAIRHAQAAEVPIVIALNKIDIPGVDTNKIYGQLAEHDLVPTEWGGQTDVIKTSAETGEGISELVEHLDLVADINEFKADPGIPATGWVVEARMTSTQGVVATVLIREGCMKKGDVILAGSGFGRIRSMKNSFGKSLKEAKSSMPVEVTGLSDVPSAGDKFFILRDINKAQKAAEEMKSQARERRLSKRSQVTLDNLFSQIEAGNVQELKVIIRADVQGSVDVLHKYISDLTTEEIRINIIHSGVGGVTEGDVVLAEASDAVIIGFNVVPDVKVKQLADAKGVDIRLYNVIYRITEELKDAMSGMLAPDEVEQTLGRLKVRDTFRVPGVGTIAGCYVTDGKVTRNSRVRLIRDNIVIKDNASVDSLKHFKEDVREIKSGYECGLKIAGYDDVKVDDQIEAYEIVEVKRTVE
ncbi:Translation initiation factor IF-2 [Sedimentisphaera cyanobacteriorum]|uniref:Translation initiation factor IF-2 n=1 Tax=Sedimentisphaera cyanobacteriorum TaxID=1940790 RepID=A0A1Q2HSH7_9BACT|nr:translation initiation factor IF-2 [Sedimentisphaera cyanobacteriorum]AQQ10195.1 Translation initiation factor IF-2 [Sedimentisphaera cyanobacteriorum]